MKRIHLAGKKRTLLIILFLLHIAHASAAQWQSKNRIQIGCELDNNIYETETNRESEPALRLLFQSHWERRSRLANLTFSGVIGYQGYATEAREDKITDEWQVRVERRLGRRLSAGIDGWARLKHFLYDSIDYHSAAATFFTRLTLPRSWTMALSIQPQIQNYWNSSIYDQHGLELSGVVNKSFSRQFNLEISVTHAQLDFNRPAFWQPTLLDSLISRGRSQTDQMQRLAVNFRYLRGFFISGGYFLENCRSNNYGLSYTSQRWLASFSKKIQPHLLLRLYTMLQKKHYRESLAVLAPLQPDSERNESNFFIADLSYFVAPETALFFRLAWHRNESLFRSRYYQKQTFIAGLESRF